MLHIFLRVIAILITSYITKVGIDLSLVPKMALHAVWIALLVYLILAVVNHTIKPLLHIVSLPINLITLGLFSFVINGMMIMIASKVVDGFHIPNLAMAIWFAFVLSVVNFTLHFFDSE